MAILKNLWVKGAKKRLGGAVLYNRMGDQCVRELAPEVKNPKTPQQMSIRVRWANPIMFYRANQAWMNKAFEIKKENQTDFNKFMSLNVSKSQVYLTKEEAAAGTAICAPYIVADGTLQPITVTQVNNGWDTSLYVPTDFKVTSRTTIGELTAALISKNANIQEGDQISLVTERQWNNVSMGIMRLEARYFEVRLLGSSAELLSKYLPTAYLNVLVTNVGASLNIVPELDEAGIAIIHSRTVGGKIKVSPAVITMAQNADVYNAYTTKEQYNKAVASYKQGDAYFLDSNFAEAADGQSAPLSILGLVTENGVFPTYLTNTNWGQVVSQELSFMFNFNPKGSIDMHAYVKIPSGQWKELDISDPVGNKVGIDSSASNLGVNNGNDNWNGPFEYKVIYGNEELLYELDATGGGGM